MNRWREQPDLRVAYRAAWAHRQATGDKSDEVLVRRLRLEGVHVSPDADELLLGIWRDGVPPRRLVWELVRRGLTPLGSAVKMLAATFRNGPRSVPFEQAISDDELTALVRYSFSDLAENEDRSISVLAAPGPDSVPPWLEVYLGDTLVARARLDAEQWKTVGEVRESEGEIDLSLSLGYLDGRFHLEDVLFGGLLDEQDEENDLE